MATARNTDRKKTIEALIALEKNHSSWLSYQREITKYLALEGYTWEKITTDYIPTIKTISQLAQKA
tara:strand:- start:186 stop:383 length:198 start_codon:yes stop_codon:yes gene_type:complete